MLLSFSYADFEEQNMKFEKVNILFLLKVQGTTICSLFVCIRIVYLKGRDGYGQIKRNLKHILHESAERSGLGLSIKHCVT